jgi:CSLREA domain-containing protein
MQPYRLLPPLLPFLVLAACGEEQAPTSPTAPGATGGPEFSHTAGHKIVNSLADPGDGTCNAAQCTLREAIKDPQSTEISFAPSLGGTIILARPGAGGGELVIAKRLSITGPSARIVIRRRSTDPAFRILRITSTGIVRLANLSLQNGKFDGPAGGGGIVNYGTLTLINCVVAGNSAALRGGGISNLAGTLTLTNSRVADNSAQIGGGISLRLGTLTLTNSTVAGNSAFIGDLHVPGGGGIDAFQVTATLTNTRIVDNSTASEGGGIRAIESRFTLTKSTVAGNSAGDSGAGGIFNGGGRFTITGSTISGNSAVSLRGGSGGGILIATFREPATLILTNSTVSGNSARAGGGIVQFGPFTVITNSTVVGNSAEQGGGIFSSGDVSRPMLTNSLVAQNSAPTGPDLLTLFGATVGARFSLIGNGSGNSITITNGNQVGTASNPIDPKLGPLANNGGPTRTHALLLGSPAIDAASTPDCPTTDQRGVLRPQGAACDIGSYERRQ